MIKCDDSYIEIDFPSESFGNKTFVFPDAFENFLTLVDENTANLVEELVQERKQEYEEEAQRLKELKILEEEERERALRRERLMRARRSRKIHPRLQSVFWCEPEEIDSVFSEWKIFTGVIQSGQKKGEPKRLARMSPNSACLLTRRDSDAEEKTRQVLGVFMVDETFDVRECEDGFIPAHSEHRLRLSEEESQKILFWNYYINKRYPHRTTWNTGRHRYFHNTWMAKILRDIVSLKEGTEEYENAQRFFEYFCEINRINAKELPDPGGALMRDK